MLHRSHNFIQQKDKRVDDQHDWRARKTKMGEGNRE